MRIELNKLTDFLRKIGENKTNKKAPGKKTPDEIIRETTLDTLSNLHSLVEKHGIMRFNLTKGFSLDRDNEIIAHRDIVAASEEGKLYVISAYAGHSNSTLQIADYKIQEGIQRTLLFRDNLPKKSLKFEKDGLLIRYCADGLTSEQQAAFLNEVSKAKVDVEATKELGRKRLN